MDYVAKAPVDIGIMLIKKAIDGEWDEKVWQMWLSVFPYMTEKNYISYYDYREKLLRSSQTGGHDQTDEEMMAMCKMLNAAFGGTVVEK